MSHISVYHIFDYWITVSRTPLAIMSTLHTVVAVIFKVLTFQVFCRHSFVVVTSSPSIRRCLLKAPVPHTSRYLGGANTGIYTGEHLILLHLIVLKRIWIFCCPHSEHTQKIHSFFFQCILLIRNGSYVGNCSFSRWCSS